MSSVHMKVAAYLKHTFGNQKDHDKEKYLDSNNSHDNNSNNTINTIVITTIIAGRVIMIITIAMIIQRYVLCEPGILGPGESLAPWRLPGDWHAEVWMPLACFPSRTYRLQPFGPWDFIRTL